MKNTQCRTSAETEALLMEKSVINLAIQLTERWQDEHQYEDKHDYGHALSKLSGVLCFPKVEGSVIWWQVPCTDGNPYVVRVHMSDTESNYELLQLGSGQRKSHH